MCQYSYYTHLICLRTEQVLNCTLHSLPLLHLTRPHTRYPKDEIRFRADRDCSQLARGGIRVSVLAFTIQIHGFLADLWRCHGTHELTPRCHSRRCRDICNMPRCMGSPSHTRREGFRRGYDSGSSRVSERYLDC